MPKIGKGPRAPLSRGQSPCRGQLNIYKCSRRPRITFSAFGFVNSDEKFFGENAGFGGQYCSSSPFGGADPDVEHDMTRPNYPDSSYQILMPRTKFDSDPMDSSEEEVLVSYGKIGGRAPSAPPYRGPIAMQSTT